MPRKLVAARLVLAQLAAWASLFVLGLVAEVLRGALLDVVGRSDASHLVAATGEGLLLVSVGWP